MVVLQRGHAGVRPSPARCRACHLMLLHFVIGHGRLSDTAPRSARQQQQQHRLALAWSSGRLSPRTRSEPLRSVGKLPITPTFRSTDGTAVGY